VNRFRPWWLAVMIIVGVGVYLAVTSLGPKPEPPTPDRVERVAPTRPSVSREPHVPSWEEDEIGPPVEAPTHLPELVPMDLEGNAAVSGRVLAPDGKPIEGAEVWCLLESAAQTDETGQFEFGGLTPGEQLISADHTQFLSSTFGPMQVPANYWLRSVEIRLAEGGFISGIVTDEHGAPTEKASISFKINMERPNAQNEPAESSPTQIEPARTDVSGVYRSRALVSGRYTVQATHKNLLPSDACTVEVVVGGTTAGVDLTLKEGLAIAGRVTDNHGNAVPNAEVSIEKWAKGIDREVLTDEDGTFVMRGLKQESYTVEVEASDFYDAYRRNVTAPAEDVVFTLSPLPVVKGRVVDKLTQQPVEVFVVAPYYDKPQRMRRHEGGRFKLKGAVFGLMYVKAPGYAPMMIQRPKSRRALESEEIVVELVKGATLTLHITAADNGRAVQGARVTRKALRLRGKTDELGTLSFEHFPLGRQKLFIEHADFLTKKIIVDVGEDEDQKTVEATLDKGLVVHGQVVAGEEGTPVAKARVKLLSPYRREPPEGYMACYPSEGFLEHTATTDQNGEFEISVVKPGACILIVKHTDYATSEERFELDRASNEELLVEMYAGGRIVGTITTSQGAPAAGARVWFQPDRLGLAKKRWRTDPEGNYEISGLQPGSYQLVAEFKRQIVIRDVTVHDKLDTRVDIGFTSTLAVNVFNVGGDLVPQALVVLDLGNPALRYFFPRTKTEDGSAIFEHVADGDYTVRVRCDGYENAAVPIRIAGRDEVVNVTLTPKNVKTE